MTYIIYPWVPKTSRSVLQCTHSVPDGRSRR